MSLQTNQQQAEYRLQTGAVGLLAAISNETLTEVSQLKQNEDRSWHLQRFSQQRTKDKLRHQQFNIEPINNALQATGESDGTAFTLAAPATVWDRSSVQLALTCDLLTETKPRPAYDYSVVDSGSISTYHFEYRGAETIRIADRKFDTVKFERKSGERTTVFWMASAMQYMPVRMEQYKKGSLHLRMNLDIPATDIP